MTAPGFDQALFVRGPHHAADIDACVTVTQSADVHGASAHSKGDAVTLSFHCEAAVPLHEDDAYASERPCAAVPDVRKAA